jgi:two-component system, chemotaxis family, chemotaxis protein CheY
MPLADTSELRVLIVDDSIHIRKIIKAVCNSMGIRKISEASDGRAATEQIQAKKDKITGPGIRFYDLIICDWQMPEMNGIELLRTIRSDPTLQKTPFLMVTAEQNKDLVAEAIAEGVNDYIIKPFTAEVLERKITRVMEKARLEAAF